MLNLMNVINGDLLYAKRNRRIDTFGNKVTL
jgi:hypothetical protein